MRALWLVSGGLSLRRRRHWLPAVLAVLVSMAGAWGPPDAAVGATPGGAGAVPAAVAAGESADARRVEALARVNAALEAWIAAADADRPFLLLDRGEGRLFLRHKGALLRDCRVMADSLGPTPAGRQVLSRHIRRYRHASPYVEPQPAPFDWEQYLAEAATPEAALYFDSGLLLYAAAAWGVPRPPAARLSVGDLRALSDALSHGTVLVVLPTGWRTAGEAAGPAVGQR